MMMEVVLRQLETIDELTTVRTLEDEIWKNDAIPTHQTSTAIKHGGITVGAFVDEQLVGFSYGWPGFKAGQVYFCSHNMGIDENFRSLGIGEKLKRKQREIAKESGYEFISWTFDPLETRNAYLNLTKLGAYCHTYIENCYGEIKDGLNSGLPTDRFQVKWEVGELPIEKLTLPKRFSDIIPWEMTGDQFPKITTIDHLTLDPFVQIPVPSMLQEMKQKDMELALDWRLKTREIFQYYFQHGYTAIRLVKSDSPLIYYYQLVKLP